MYLNETDFALLSQLPARLLAKTRHSVAPFGIDAFEDELGGLVLAEAEFDSIESAEALRVPDYFVHEVTSDVRFTGGRLASTSRTELSKLLREFGVQPLSSA